MKNTKRALLASVLSVLMCISMLVGSTFAWFTDSATTGVNQIQAGTIDIRLTDMDGNNMEGKTLKWVDVNGNSDILWEPGVTFMTEPVRLWNYSNLSFVLDFTVTGFSGDMKLLEALEYKLVQVEDMYDDDDKLLPYDQIPEAPLSKGALQAEWFGLQADWGEDIVEGTNTIPVGVGDPKPLTDVCVIAHMKEDAGNEYQGLKLTTASITFMAKQFTFEYDSYSNQYDATAAWPVIVGSADQLDDLLNDDNVTKMTVVGGQYDDTIVIPTGKTLTSENGMFTPANKYASAVNVESGANIVLNGGTYMSSGQQIINSQSSESTVLINDGIYNGTCLIWNGGSSEVVINGGEFDLWSLTVVDTETSCTLTINGGNFVLDSVSGNSYNGFTAGTSAPLVINGGTFNQNPSMWVSAGHTVTDNGDGTWTVQ